jgi:hypothetical protein
MLGPPLESASSLGHESAWAMTQPGAKGALIVTAERSGRDGIWGLLEIRLGTGAERAPP